MSDPGEKHSRFFYYSDHADVAHSEPRSRKDGEGYRQWDAQKLESECKDAEGGQEEESATGESPMVDISDQVSLLAAHRPRRRHPAANTLREGR